MHDQYQQIVDTSTWHAHISPSPKVTFLVCTWRHQNLKSWCFKALIVICFRTLLYKYSQKFEFMQVPQVTNINKSMHIEMFNVLKYTWKLLLVWFAARTKQFEQKLCIAKTFFVLTAMLVFLKGTRTRPPHSFLFKVFLFLLAHI